MIERNGVRYHGLWQDDDYSYWTLLSNQHSWEEWEATDKTSEWNGQTWVEMRWKGGKGT